MVKERAGRNRTICLTKEQERRYVNKCADKNALSRNGSLNDEIVLADCFHVLPSLPDSFVDLAIVDPPYNLDKTFGSSKFRKMRTGEYEAFTRKWIESIAHTLKQTASVYVCCDWKTSIIIGRVLTDYFIIQNRITWQREKGRGALSNWKNAMEDIWFATMSNNFTFNANAVKQRRKVIAPYRIDGKPKDWRETAEGNFRDTFPANFWDDISIPYWSMPENTDHPAQKPEKLFAKLVLASSNSGDMVFDPFAGAGTSSVVCKKLNRRFIGIEMEPEYCALAKRRLEMADADSSIQGYSDNVFWERNSFAEQKRRAADKINEKPVPTANPLR